MRSVFRDFRIVLIAICVAMQCCVASAQLVEKSNEQKPADAPQNVESTEKTDSKKSETEKSEKDSTPPGLTEYKGRKIAQYMSYEGAPWLIRENRERQEACETLLKNLHIKEGMSICDLGCGNGYYTLKLSKLVGEKGRIYAVDIQTEMLHLLKERAKEEKALDNIEAILGNVADPRLPDGKVDLILLVDVYHEFSHPEHMLAAMRKALSPKGRLVLVEFRKEDPKVAIKEDHKMTKEQILKELLPNGYKLAEEFEKLPWQHVMFFEADPDWKSNDKR